MGVLDVINQLLKKKTTGTEKKKIFHEKIISNCFFGMANKEVEKALEQNTTAMTGKIRDAVSNYITTFRSMIFLPLRKYTKTLMYSNQTQMF